MVLVSYAVLVPVQELLVFPVISLASHLSEPESLHGHDTQQGLGLWDQPQEGDRLDYLSVMNLFSCFFQIIL